jgi:hypothetical protein
MREALLDRLAQDTGLAGIVRAKEIFDLLDSSGRERTREGEPSGSYISDLVTIPWASKPPRTSATHPRSAWHRPGPD